MDNEFGYDAMVHKPAPEHIPRRKGGGTDRRCIFRPSRVKPMRSRWSVYDGPNGVWSVDEDGQDRGDDGEFVSSDALEVRMLTQVWLNKNSSLLLGAQTDQKEMKFWSQTLKMSLVELGLSLR
jgi:hypothetical protein